VAELGRYDGLAIATTTIPGGNGSSRGVRYWRRRLLPPADGMEPLALHVVTANDRLDLVTARYLGDPTAFWWVADANPGLDPDALVAPDAEGTVLVIPVPRT
jgi:hypothetical protein